MAVKSKDVKKWGISAKSDTSMKRVQFALSVANANQVSLAGDFNNWDPMLTPLRKGREDKWFTELKLSPGRYEYKFVVDGNWISDPNNKNKVMNSFGSDNSIINV